MISVSLVILALLTVFAYVTALVTWDGAVVGFLLGYLFAEMSSPAPFIAFLAFVLLGSYSTKLGSRTKVELGVAQSNRGRRGFLHALANVGPAALFAVLSSRWLAGTDLIFEIATCGGLAAVLADTVASECGQWLGGQPRSILSWKPVAIGSDGGVTRAGMLCSSAAALFLGVVVLPWLGVVGAAIIFLSGLFGNLADSVLGASIESSLGPYGGFLVNACASAAGLLSGYLLASTFVS